MKFSLFEETRQGKRQVNEDCLACCHSQDSLLMVIADGMGGHRYGEIASHIAVKTLLDAFRQQANPSIADPFLFIEQAMLQAHHAMLEFSRSRQLTDDFPCTTCVCCIVQRDLAYWAHVGDSRLYLIRDGRMHARTRDHSKVFLLLEQGLITDFEAKFHPERNKIYNCLGGGQLPEIEFSRITPLEEGDVLLLSTDGFWASLDEGVMVNALGVSDWREVMSSLVNQAEEGGGDSCDNLSVVAVRWESPGFYAPTSHASSLQLKYSEISTKFLQLSHLFEESSEIPDKEMAKTIEEIRFTIGRHFSPERK